MPFLVNNNSDSRCWVLGCVCSAQPLNAHAQGTAMYSPCGAVPFFGQPVSLGIPWLLRNHQLDAPCLVKGLFLSWGNAWWWWWFPFCWGRVHSMEEREDRKDRLDFVRNQLNILTEDTKEKIRRVTEEVESKVSQDSGNNFLGPSVASSLRQLLLEPAYLRNYVWNVRMFLFQYKKKENQKVKLAIFSDCQVIEWFLETVRTVVCFYSVWKRWQKHFMYFLCSSRSPLPWLMRFAGFQF